MYDAMKRFTAEVSEGTMKRAKIAAIKAGMPLIHWAGRVITEYVEGKLDRKPIAKAAK